MISHHHRALFTHIPKCGGQSIERAFLHDLDLDWERRAPLLLHTNDQPLVGPQRLAHLTTAQYLDYKYLTPRQFETYYKFTTTRHPLKRAVSLYNYLYTTPFSPSEKFKLRMKRRFLRKDFEFSDFYDAFIEPAFSSAAQRDDASTAYHEGWYWFVRPQAEYLYRGSELLVDQVIELGDLSSEWSALRQRFGLNEDIGHTNTSKSRFGVGDLSDKHTKQLRNLYAEDFEKFGYD